MYEYQFNIEHIGVHLFRTDWYTGHYAKKIEASLWEAYATLPGHLVTVSRRSMIQQSAEKIEDFR